MKLRPDGSAARLPMTTTNPRAAILRAADRLLGSRGYQRMHMEDVAREAGVGKSTIYHHFSSKEEMALASIDDLIARVLARMLRHAVGGGTVEERLRRMLLARIRMRLLGVKHYRHALDDLVARIRPRLIERRREHFRKEAGLLARVLREGIKTGELRPLDSDRAAAALITGTNALLPYDLSAREVEQPDRVEAEARLVIDLLVHGLVATRRAVGATTRS